MDEYKGVARRTARKKAREYLKPKTAVQGSSDLTTAGYSINERASDWPPPIYDCARTEYKD